MEGVLYLHVGMSDPGLADYVGGQAHGSGQALHRTVYAVWRVLRYVRGPLSVVYTVVRLLGESRRLGRVL